MSKPDVKLDWCSHAAAKYAVERWHYSACLPASKSVYIGVWESRRFVGAVIFSQGANYLAVNKLAGQLEACELTRVALKKSHATPVTKIIAIAIRMLQQTNPGLQLVYSYADPMQNHHGGIYQGGNWIYVGVGSTSRQYRYRGKWVHARTITGANFGCPKALSNDALKTLPCRKVTGKHKYLYPLNAAMRKQIEPLRKPYPKRVRSVDSDTLAIQAGKGGASPTRTLSD
jgi:hypothetical protein